MNDTAQNSAPTPTLTPAPLKLFTSGEGADQVGCSRTQFKTIAEYLKLDCITLTNLTKLYSAPQVERVAKEWHRRREMELRR